MATPVVKNNSIFGVEIESTEGTYVAPQASTSYIQPESDGFDFKPSRETLDRKILTTSIGRATPKLGTKSASGGLTVELRASGTEGADVDFGALLKGALGATRAIASTTTTKSSGNTGTILQIDDADISKFTVGDIIVVKQTGAYHVSPITAVDASSGTANITLLVAKPSGSFANSVVISKTKMYYTATTGHPSLSMSYYMGNEIRQAAAGAKVTDMSVDNFTAGQLAKLKFGWEALTFTEVNGVAPQTPAFDTGTPPVILEACLYKNGSDLPINTFGLTIKNSLAFQTSTCSANGKTGSRVVERTVQGTINPYMDDTDVSLFDAFVAGTEFSLFIRAYNPDGTTVVTLGSAVGIYLPKCIITEFSHGDLDGLLSNEISFQAVRGADGATEEVYFGLI